MSDRKDRIAAATRSRGTRTAAPAATPQEPTEAPKPRPKPKKRGESARRSTPVRMTIDLDPPAYTKMRRVLLDVADEADHPTLTAAAMWRATLEELADDPRLIARVAKRITATKEPS